MIKDLDSKKIIMISFGKDTGLIKKAKIRRLNDSFQLEYIFNDKAFQKNIEESDILNELTELLGKSFKECVIYMTDLDLYIFRNSKGILSVRKKKATKIMKDNSHDDEKNYILMNGIGSPYLYDLGICDEEGNVTDKGSKKFRQINRFLEIVGSDIDKIAVKNRQIKAVDFCCGKGYLTFALHQYLTEIRGLDAYVTGIDLKQDVIEELNTITMKYKLENLMYMNADINSYNENLDIAVGLHACDIATDIFLSNAVTHNAKMIFSVPCCQHQLFKQIKNDDLKYMLSYGIQKDRMTELLTNTLRVLALRARGYSVDMIEFIPIEHTMKNIMIKAVFTGICDKKAESEFTSLKERFNIVELEGDKILNK